MWVVWGGVGMGGIVERHGGMEAVLGSVWRRIVCLSPPPAAERRRAPPPTLQSSRWWQACRTLLSVIAQFRW